MNFLDESNFLLYAAKYYDNPQCYDTEEFFDDLNRFKYLKRLFNRYEESGDLKYRLILNHLIILYNVFGPIATTRMLFFKLKGQYKFLKPFLVLLGYMPDVIYKLSDDEDHIISSDIPMDHKIVKTLREL
jgi:hypothetical protein